MFNIDDLPQAFNIVRNTFNRKRFMFDIVAELRWFYYRLLGQQKQYSELCSFIGWLPENTPSESEYLDIIIYISCLKGDLASAKKSAKRLMAIKPQRKPDLLMRIAIWDLYSYDLVDFDETTAELIKIETREKEKIQIEILQSQVGLLKGDNDFAFEHAKAAQKLAKDLPASPAHPNLFSVCIKTGHDFG
jgi:ATP/maltotriose-dependent transcriptional regulator MalT